MPSLRQLVAGPLPRRSDFDPRSVHVGFVVDTVTLEQDYCSVIIWTILAENHLRNNTQENKSLRVWSKRHPLSLCDPTNVAVSVVCCPVKVVVLLDRHVSSRRSVSEEDEKPVSAQLEMCVDGSTEVVGVLRNKIRKGSRASNTNWKLRGAEHFRN